MSKTAELPKHINDSIEILGYGGATGYVRKKAAGTYVLVDHANRSRSRWGNAAEIREDIAHFVKYGTLQPPSGGRW